MSEKRLFLIAYDYGMGGLWAPMLARSVAEILARYPELGVFAERPSLLTEENYASLLHQRPILDVDEEPRGLLLAVLADRK